MKQQVMETFSLSAEDGDLLVPDPILSFKFDTHVKQPGVWSVAFVDTKH